jgi:phosphoglycerol transferase MdoB-like AlkP superfamily enzyme
MLHLYKKSKNLFVFILLVISCIGISLLPVISLGADVHDSEAERYLYPASVFACLLLVYILNSLIKKINHVAKIMVLIIGCHLYFLYQSSTAYRYASYVSRFVIESLNTVPGIKYVTFTNLPSQYKGALIFRIGFAKYAPGILAATYDTVQINSFKELTERKTFTRLVTANDKTSSHLYIDFSNDTLLLYR